MSTNIEIKKVETKHDLQVFIDFYYQLYEGSPYAVPFIRFDEVNTLRPDKNPSFDFCDAEYYLAYRNGHVVGRLAAISNRRAN